MVIFGSVDLTNPAYILSLKSKPVRVDAQSDQSVKPEGTQVVKAIPGIHFPDPDSLDMSHFDK